MIETMFLKPLADNPIILQSTPVRIAGRRRRQVSLFDISLIDEPGTLMMLPILRKLAAEDAPAFQALRLEGLANHPCEFGAAIEEEADLPISEVERRLEEDQIYGAFVDGKLAAIAGFRRFERIKKQHKGKLSGVFVSKDFRGKGLGEAVVRQVIAFARGEVEQLLATVANLNHPAKALYAKLGFEVFGCEPRAHKVGDRYYDQDHLVLMLK